MNRRILAAVTVLIILLIAACGTAAPTPTSTPKPTTVPPTLPPPTPTTAPEPTAAPVALQLVAGEKAFNNYCAGCHSAGIAKDRLVRYRTADTLFEFLRMSMPPGNPQSLSEERHYDITAYLLADAGLMAADQVVNAETAANIVLLAPGEAAKPEQVVAGEKAFKRYCGSCHSGGFAESKIARYGTAEKLFSFLRVAMPPGNPTQVSEQSDYDIVAYILSEASFLQPNEVVNADTAASVSFGD